MADKADALHFDHGTVHVDTHQGLGQRPGFGYPLTLAIHGEITGGLVRPNQPIRGLAWYVEFHLGDEGMLGFIHMPRYRGLRIMGHAFEDRFASFTIAAIIGGGCPREQRHCDPQT